MIGIPAVWSVPDVGRTPVHRSSVTAQILRYDLESSRNRTGTGHFCRRCCRYRGNAFELYFSKSDTEGVNLARRLPEAFGRDLGASLVGEMSRRAGGRRNIPAHPPPIGLSAYRIGNLEIVHVCQTSVCRRVPRVVIRIKICVRSAIATIGFISLSYRVCTVVVERVAPAAQIKYRISAINGLWPQSLVAAVRKGHRVGICSGNYHDLPDHLPIVILNQNGLGPMVELINRFHRIAMRKS